MTFLELEQRLCSPLWCSQYTVHVKSQPDEKVITAEADPPLMCRISPSIQRQRQEIVTICVCLSQWSHILRGVDWVAGSTPSLQIVQYLRPLRRFTTLRLQKVRWLSLKGSRADAGKVPKLILERIQSWYWKGSKADTGKVPKLILERIQSWYSKGSKANTGKDPKLILERIQSWYWKGSKLILERIQSWHWKGTLLKGPKVGLRIERKLRSVQRIQQGPDRWLKAEQSVKPLVSWGKRMIPPQ